MSDIYSIMTLEKLLNDLSKDANKAHNLTKKDLETILKKASDAYYNTGTSIISDELFDTLKDLLELKDPDNEFLSDVGAPVKGLSNKATLPFPMFSLDKVKPETGDLQKFERKYRGPYVLSDKLDGASCMAVYKRRNGNIYDLKLFRRGTGLVGADISHLAKFLIPVSRLNRPPSDLEDDIVAIRGEVIMSRKDFDHFRTDFKDARGLVNGIINRKTPDERTLAHTSFVAYEVVYPRLSKSDQMKCLDRSGFDTVAWTSQKDLSEKKMIEFYDARRKNSSFMIDGIVVEDDGPHNSPTSSNPDYAFAFKMQLASQSATVRVIEVFWEISKDGRLVPRIQYEPVDINGVTLQFATVYNAKFVIDNGIGPNAIINVIRSGDVIPKVVSVEKKVSPSLPVIPYQWGESGVDIYIDDIEENDAVKIRRLVKFFSEMGIENISRGLVSRFYEYGFVSLAQYLKATPNTFMNLPGVQKTLAEKLVDNIQTHIKKVSVAKVMAASNIFGTGVGEKKLDVVIRQMPDILNGKYSRTMILDGLEGLEGFQSKTAEKIAEGVPPFIKFLKDHPEITVVTSKKKSKDLPLTGQVFVITGFRDKSLQGILEELGAEVASSVSSRTTILVTKDPNSTSGKTKQARDLNIKIMTKEQLDYYLSQI